MNEKDFETYAEALNNACKRGRRQKNKLRLLEEQLHKTAPLLVDEIAAARSDILIQERAERAAVANLWRALKIKYDIQSI